jgi:hypothetical protein
LEYLLDDSGNEMLFENQTAAKEFLITHGIDEEDLDLYVFESEGKI